MGAAVGFRAHRNGAGAVKRPRAFGFDFDHTLGIDNKLERVAFLRLLDTVCREGGRCIGTLAEEIARVDALLQRQREGRCTIEHAVERFVVERGLEGSSSYVDRYKAFALESVDAFVIPEPGLGELLAGLRASGIPYAILTNGWSPLQERKAERADFDGPVVVSSKIGVQKPQRGAFEALARVLALPADSIAYVGDNPQIDVAGALAAGMPAVWFDAEDTGYPPGVAAASAVIHSLPELLAVS